MRRKQRRGQHTGGADVANISTLRGLRNPESSCRELYGWLKPTIISVFPCLMLVIPHFVTKLITSGPNKSKTDRLKSHFSYWWLFFPCVCWRSDVNTSSGDSRQGRRNDLGKSQVEGIARLAQELPCPFLRTQFHKRPNRYGWHGTWYSKLAQHVWK